jgi:hypothetical protein
MSARICASTLAFSVNFGPASSAQAKDIGIDMLDASPEASAGTAASE